MTDRSWRRVWTCLTGRIWPRRCLRIASPVPRIFPLPGGFRPAWPGAGIAVLRFDFTGLGHSGGEFENTSFATNISDLTLAADALNAEGLSPSLLIGHSLGGAAVLGAARKIASVKAVVHHRGAL